MVDNSMSRLAFRQLADLKVEMVVVSGDSKVRAHHSPGADFAECPFMTKTDECDLVSRFFCLVPIMRMGGVAAASAKGGRPFTASTVLNRL